MSVENRALMINNQFPIELTRQVLGKCEFLVVQRTIISSKIAQQVLSTEYFCRSLLECQGPGEMTCRKFEVLLNGCRSSIRVLDLNRIKHEGQLALDFIGICPNLQTLIFPDWWARTNVCPQQIDRLVQIHSSLQQLCYRERGAHPEMRANISQYTQLKHLTLSGCNDDYTLGRLVTLTHLTQLRFSPYNPTSDTGLNYLSSLTKLTHLEFPYNDGYGLVWLNDACLEKIGKLTQLLFLDLYYNTNFSNEGIAQLSNLTNLESLYIFHREQAQGPLDDRALETLAKMTKLSALSIPGWHITSEGLYKITHLTNLTFLNVGKSQIKITHLVLEVLLRLPKLKRLVVTDLGLNETLITAAKTMFTQLSNLEISWK